VECDAPLVSTDEPDYDSGRSFWPPLRVSRYCLDVNARETSWRSPSQASPFTMNSRCVRCRHRHLRWVHRSRQLRQRRRPRRSSHSI